MNLLRTACISAMVLAALNLTACTAMKNKIPIGIRGGGLAPCPGAPNCVSSDAADQAHRIAPFPLAVSPEAAWAELCSVVAARPRTRIAAAENRYLHAEEKSRLFGFVDDIEFHLRPSEGIIAVRSASRTGYSDLGVNRKRVEAIRSELIGRGVVRPLPGRSGGRPP